MKEAARGFSSGTVSERIRPALDGALIQPELRRLSSAFVELQQARHEADYDLLRSFTRAEALDLLDQADQSFRDWDTVKGTIQADVFLMSLLVLNAIKN
jgi:hypothetical protein